MRNVTVICNVPHDIVEGECALCERDAAIKDALRYRELRSMIGPLQIIIGPIIGIPEHAPSRCDYNKLRADLDDELDHRIAARIPKTA